MQKKDDNKSKEKKEEKTKKNELKEKKEKGLVKSEKLLTKKDYKYMLIITIIYAIVSFFNLGSFTNPQTFYTFKNKNDSVVFKNESKQNISSVKYFSGVRATKCSISFSHDNITYESSLSLSNDKVLAWLETKLHANYEYIKISGADTESILGEIAFYDSNGNIINMMPMDENAKLLIDEQSVVPDTITYMDTSYFDEVYFPRTAYEILHGMKIYEWTHPPLGKLMMAVPIALFGMTPFAYRVLGNICGILMIPAMYVFAKTLFKKSKYAILAACIMALDGMHFAQTRIGTVDSYLVLFIILEYLFMYKYTISSDKPLRKRLLMLFLSGLFMALSIAIKWNGVFSAIGLAIIFFANLIREIIKKREWTKDYTVTILCCVVFFIIIPVLIYVLSFTPFFVGPSKEISTLDGFIKQQQKMYNYHHDLNATHPYTSMWYTWPITQKSLLFWTGDVANGKISRIALLGNPLIFWFSIPCMIFVLLHNRKFKYWFLIIAIASMYIPYMFIHRIMFIYHYFPILPFAMLSIVAFMEWLCEKKKWNWPIYVFIILIFITFIAFYPVYSGFPASRDYLESLKWLKTWIW